MTPTGRAGEHLDHLAFRPHFSDSGVGAPVVTAKPGGISQLGVHRR